MENNIQDDTRVPSISMVVEGRRRAPYNPEQDVVQEYRLAREIPINEHMFAHTEIVRLDIIEALRSATISTGSLMFPLGSGILIPSAQDPYLVNESYSLQVSVREPRSYEEYQRFAQALSEAHRRHNEL